MLKQQQLQRLKQQQQKQQRQQKQQQQQQHHHQQQQQQQRRQQQQQQQRQQQQQHRVIHHLIHYAFRFRCILFQAPESGAYTFYIAGDDQCEFWISTDETATNAKYQMGFAIGQWTNPNQWNK